MEQFWNEYYIVIIGAVLYVVIIGGFMLFGKFLKQCDENINEMWRKK